LKRITFPLLILFAASLLFFKVGSVPLFEPDEGRYANVAQEMLQSGDWVVPRKNGFVHFHKPPLTYWSMAFSQIIFGSNEFGIRLPNVLFGLGILFLVFRFARRWWGESEAVVATCLLLATPLFVFMSRLATTDIGLVFWVTAAIYGLSRYRAEQKPITLLAVYGALGLAMITKGPIGLLLFFFAVIPFSIWVKKPFFTRFLGWHLLGLIVFLGIALPWYLWIVKTNPELLEYFLVHQTADRIASAKHHSASIFYFFPVFIALFFPWSFFVPAAVKDTLRLAKTDPQRKLFLWFFVWGSAIFIFFSLVPSKLASYLLPLSLPLALWLSPYIAKRLNEDGSQDNWFRGTVWVIGLIFWMSGIGLGIYTKFFIHTRIEALQGLFLIVSLFVMIIGLVLVALIQTKKQRGVILSLLIGLYTLFFIVWAGLTNVGTYKNAKPIAEKILEVRQPGEVVLAYRSIPLSLPFYLGERVFVFGSKIDTQFTPQRELDNIHTNELEAIDIFIHNPSRCFIYSKHSDARELYERNPGKLYELVRGYRYVLLSNKP